MEKKDTWLETALKTREGDRGATNAMTLDILLANVPIDINQ